MVIREATEADRARLVELGGHFLDGTDYGSLFDYSRDGLDDLVSLSLKLGAILVADVEGTLEGFLAVVVLRHPITKHLYADELAWWVEPAVRQQGVGDALMRALHEWARQRRLTMIKLVAPAGSEVGAFYERLGYSRIETAYAMRL